VRSFELIREYYAPPVEMESLARAALIAIHNSAPVNDEMRCAAGNSAVVRDASPKEFTDVARAFRCAAPGADSDPIAADALADTAIAAMVSRLDKQTRFLTPLKVQRLVPTSEDRASVGLTLESRPEGFFVVGARPTTPAGAAGIREGDKLIAIEGIPAARLSLSDVIEKLRGAEGSPVNLTMQRAGSPACTVTLSRKLISALDSALEFVRRGSALIIHIQGMPKGIAEAVKTGMSSELFVPTTIIIDLRNNSGGRLDQAIELADLFLDEGTIVTSRGRGKRDVETYRARKGQVAPGVPMIVVVNHGTAAGAEIVASSLQDNNRAIVLGEPTLGAGSVQTLMPLGRDYFLSFTTSFEYRPNGNMLMQAPVIPDCQSDAEPDSQWDLAIEVGAKGLTSCPHRTGL